MEDVNTRRRIFLSLSTIGCSLQQINSRKFHLHLAFKRVRRTFEKRQSHFNSDVFAAVAVVVAKASYCLLATFFAGSSLFLPPERGCFTKVLRIIFLIGTGRAKVCFVLLSSLFTLATQLSNKETLFVWSGFQLNVESNYAFALVLIYYVCKTRATFSTNQKQNQNQSHASVSRAWRRMHAFAVSSDWFAALFTFVVNVQMNCKICFWFYDAQMKTALLMVT